MPKKILSYLLTLLLIIGMIPTASFAAGAGASDPVNETDPDRFKNIQISGANSRRDMSHCYYTDKMTKYYAPFVAGKEEI